MPVIQQGQHHMLDTEALWDELVTVGQQSLGLWTLPNRTPWDPTLHTQHGMVSSLQVAGLLTCRAVHLSFV